MLDLTALDHASLTSVRRIVQSLRMNVQSLRINVQSLHMNVQSLQINVQSLRTSTNLNEPQRISTITEVKLVTANRSSPAVQRIVRATLQREKRKLKVL